jgi:glycosyltransferase involved in cell wall biosynthesis
MTERLVARHGIPYVIHLEDNEELILAGYLNAPSKPLKLWRRLRLYYNAQNRPLPHPKRYKRFIANASGATVILDALKKFVPAQIPTKTIWPACEEDVFSMPEEPDMSVRDKVGVPRDDVVITYPGNVHASNVDDVEILYNAVLAARGQGIKISLIRIGRNYARFSTDFSPVLDKYIFELGDLDPKDIPTYLRASDMMVQPGETNDFNEHRFPSKLPMFLASSRPVILTHSVMTPHLTDGYNAIILRKSTCQEIVKAIESLARSRKRRIEMGRNGRDFARKHFSWAKTAHDVSAFYNLILENNN